MRHDPDFDIDIESRYWALMSNALDKKLYLRLEKHINVMGEIALAVKVFPIDRKTECLFSEHDLAHRTELFFKVEKFVKEYKHDDAG